MHTKSSLIYLVIVGLALLAAGLESVSYFGFVHSHFYYPAYYWYIVSLFVLPISPVQPKRWLKLTLLLGSVGSLVIYAVLSSLEFLHYPNYVYTLTHIHLPALQIFVILIWIHTTYLILAHKGYILRLSGSLLLTSLVTTGVIGLGSSVAFLGKRLTLIAKKPTANYEVQMIDAYGGVYPAMRLVKSLTPDNAVILIPPQGNPWEVEGNAAMVAYFLYPRKVVNLSETLPITDLPTYALIAHGSWGRNGPMDYGWPKVKLPTKRLWRFEVASNRTQEFIRPYDPDLDKWDWGLIEVAL